MSDQFRKFSLMSRGEVRRIRSLPHRPRCKSYSPTVMMCTFAPSSFLTTNAGARRRTVGTYIERRSWPTWPTPKSSLNV
eukprot:COSAG02_NODE_6676_length_3424_cov_13.333835_5_plen_79_part_00